MSMSARVIYSTSKSFALFLLVLSFSVIYSDAIAQFPPMTIPNETTEPKDMYKSLQVIHNTPGNHDLRHHFNYSQNPWSNAYYHTQIGEFDARNEWERSGIRSFANPNEYTYVPDPNFTQNLSFTTALSGSVASEISAELGWSNAESVGWSSTTTKQWTINTAFSEEMSFSAIGMMVPSDSVLFFNFFTKFAYRQGSRYKYVIGTTTVWCLTHLCWTNEYRVTFLDYEGPPVRATSKFPIETRVVEAPPNFLDTELR